VSTEEPTTCGSPLGLRRTMPSSSKQLHAEAKQSTLTSLAHSSSSLL
jgi:hypothetical protein